MIGIQFCLLSGIGCPCFTTMEASAEDADLVDLTLVFDVGFLFSQIPLVTFDLTVATMQIHALVSAFRDRLLVISEPRYMSSLLFRTWNIYEKWIGMWGNPSHMSVSLSHLTCIHIITLSNCALVHRKCSLPNSKRHWKLLLCSVRTLFACLDLKSVANRRFRVV